MSARVRPRATGPPHPVLLLLAALAGACESAPAAREEEAASLPLFAPPERDHPPSPALTCPEGMMAVVGRFCVDRWEASLFDRSTGQRLSPYYPPDRRLALANEREWESERHRLGSWEAQQVPLPPLPDFQREQEVDPVAVSLPGVIPSAYLSGLMAERACKNADKRLCRHEEWMLACGGEARLRFPYGRAYRPGVCNLFRALHPAIVLHGSAILGHHDPRLDLVKEESGDPLLRATGGTPGCKSSWGENAAWDMNGNLDEWVDDAGGRLAGGFFSRSRREGCDATIIAHPREYYDYSTGTRCCWSPAPDAAPGR